MEKQKLNYAHKSITNYLPSERNPQNSEDYVLKFSIAFAELFPGLLVSGFSLHITRHQLSLVRIKNIKRQELWTADCGLRTTRPERNMDLRCKPPFLSPGPTVPLSRRDLRCGLTRNIHSSRLTTRLRYKLVSGCCHYCMRQACNRRDDCNLKQTTDIQASGKWQVVSL